MKNHKSSLSRKEKEARRLKAGKLFDKGHTQADVARKFKVTTSAVTRWYAAWEEGGLDALKSKGHSGFESSLTPEKRKEFKKAILKGPKDFGYETDLWTLSRLSAVLRKVCKVKFSEVWVWHIVRELGFTPQKPQVKAKERNEKAVKEWKEKTLPDLKKWAKKNGFYLAFEDESGISEKPVVRRTWALKGCTPTIQSSGSWKSLSMAGLIKFAPLGNNPELFFRLQPGSMDKYDFVEFLKDVKKEMKGKDLAQIPPKGLKHLKNLVRKSVKRVKSNKQIIKGFLKRAGALT